MMFKFALYFLYPTALVALLATRLIDQWVFACLFAPVLGLILFVTVGLWAAQVDLSGKDNNDH